MKKFEIIYVFDGKKMWDEIVANDGDEAVKQLIEKHNGNNLIFLSVAQINGQK